MQGRKSGFKTVEDFLFSKDDLKQKVTLLKRTSNPFMKKLSAPDRIKFWIALIPESLCDKIRNFYRLMKVKNSVKVLTRQKVVVDYDTLFLAKQINESIRDDYILITNSRLTMMRSVICLLLSFDKELEYHRGWSYISYALLALGATEEEMLLLFAHLILNVLPGYFKPVDNYAVKNKVNLEFYMLAERQRYSFVSLSHDSLFKIHKDDVDIYEAVNPKTKTSLFYNEHIKNYGLYTLLKSTSDEWFGSLFSNVLLPKDCMAFWDFLLIHNSRMLYKFGLTLLTKSNSKLEALIKKEKKSLTDIGVETSQHQLLLCGPAIKKFLTTSITSNDFQNMLSGALDRRDSALIADKKASTQIHELLISCPDVRVNHFAQIKKELESTIPLDTGRCLTIFQMIEDCKADKITIKEFVPLLTGGQVTFASMCVKIFILIDQNLRGYITKKNAKLFFSFMADSFERKLKLFWKESTKDKITIDGNEVTELIQSLDYYLNPDSTVLVEKAAKLYHKLVGNTPEALFTFEKLLKFIRENKICFSIFKQMMLIDGQNVEEHASEDINHTESSAGPEEIEQTEGDLNFRFDTQSKRNSTPSQAEIFTSKGISYSRKSLFDKNEDRERSGSANLKVVESMTIDMHSRELMVSKDITLSRRENPSKDTPKVSEEKFDRHDRYEPDPTMTNLEEKNGGVHTTNFVVTFPIMAAKKTNFKFG